VRRQRDGGQQGGGNKGDGQQHGGQAAPAAPLTFAQRRDASMTLITSVMEHPLDPGYAEVHARRMKNDDVPSVHTTRGKLLRVGILVLSMVFGTGLAIAVAQLRAPEPAVREARLLLEEQVTQKNDAIAAANASAETLNSEISTLQQRALAHTDPHLLADIAVDELHNGTAAVSGPGLEVTLTDGGGGLADGPDAGQMVKDHDLQVVVSALWVAGAEAVAVNDVRLTMTSAVRNAGNAVLVDLIPLTGPTYIVRGVGDAEAMQASFARSEAASYLTLLGSEYGIDSSVVQQATMDLPAAGAQTLHYAREVESTS
jgi:uncharacterized protein YlxW (UPF0749 family)